MLSRSKPMLSKKTSHYLTENTISLNYQDQAINVVYKKLIVVIIIILFKLQMGVYPVAVILQ
jgi:hypothetical protein